MALIHANFYSETLGMERSMASQLHGQRHRAPILSGQLPLSAPREEATAQGRYDLCHIVRWET